MRPTDPKTGEPLKALRSPTDLVDAGLADAADLPVLERVAQQFSVSISRDLAGLIDPNDRADPIARQFVPTAAELEVSPQERHDPIGDEPFTPVKGIVHRYPDRVLLKATNVCPVYCRFCFRRELIGPATETLSDAELDAALAYVADRPQIWEVILTGGDPLILSPRRLKRIMDAVSAIPHVGVLRVHTRVPVVDPGRISDELVSALKGRPATWVLLHSNHAREFSAEAVAAIARLVDAGIPMLGQSVLLKGVNDDAATLTALFRAMVANRIKPHYLHQGDLARGTGHFRTTIRHGQALMRELRGSISGLCQPGYTLDIPGGHGKVPIGPNYLEQEDESWSVEDPNGQRHRYQD